MTHLQRELGIVQLLMSVGGRDGTHSNIKNGNKDNRTRIRILTPRDDTIEQSLQDLRKLENFDVRYISANSGIKTKTVIVDRKDSLVVELKESQDEAPFAEAIGLSTYCNTKSTVSSYISIFESLWNQTELCDKLKNHDMPQQEFINLAAHELRTPT
jgi:two-component system sensor histidine kinase VicK